MTFRLDALLADRPITLSCEFFPAKTEAAQHAWQTVAADLVALGPDFCSVTYGAGGGTRGGTRSAVVYLQDVLGCPAMAHLTCVGASRTELHELLDEYAAVGICNLLALRGDPPKGVSDWQPHPEGPRYASELLGLIRADGRFASAVAAFPEGHPEAADPIADWGHLLVKIDAGASLAITQAFFDATCYRAMRRWLAEQGRADLRVVPGILPVRGWSWSQRFVERFAPATSLPEAMRARLEPCDGDEEAARREGLAFTLDLCRELLQAGAPGLHFYTLNEAAATRHIVETLRAEGLLPAPRRP